MCNVQSGLEIVKRLYMRCGFGEENGIVGNIQALHVFVHAYVCMYSASYNTITMYMQVHWLTSSQSKQGSIGRNTPLLAAILTVVQS